MLSSALFLLGTVISNIVSIGVSSMCPEYGGMCAASLVAAAPGSSPDGPRWNTKTHREKVNFNNNNVTINTVDTMI